MPQSTLDGVRTPWYKPLKGKMSSVATIRSTTKTNFDVERTETYIDLSPDSPEGSEFLAVDGLYCLVRTDTRRPIAPIGPNIRLTQLDVWAELALEIAKHNQGMVPTGGLLNNETAYYVSTLGADDEHTYYIGLLPEIGTVKGGAVWFASRNDSVTTHVMASSLIRHDGDAGLLAKRLSALGAGHIANYQSSLQKMAGTPLDFADRGNAYGLVWSVDGRGQKALARWHNRLAQITQVWEDSVAVAEYRSTVLGFYVALHEWSEWGRSFRGTGGDIEAINERRPLESLFGLHRNVSERCLPVLTAYKGGSKGRAKGKAKEPVAAAAKPKRKYTKRATAATPVPEPVAEVEADEVYED